MATTTRVRRRRTGSPLAYAALIAGSIGVLVPVLWMFSTSVKNRTELFTIPPRWIPNAVTFEAYRRVWTDYPFAHYFGNSLLVVSVSTAVSIAFACLAGYGVSRFKFRGSGTFLTFLLLTQMFPSIMLLIPYYKIIQQFGLINTHSALIITYVSFQLPLCTWMMMGYFRAIPRDLDESAAIDGCGRFRTFATIVLPLTLPGVAATGIYAFITGWNEYMFALVLTQSENMKTVPVGIGQLIGQYKIEWNDLMAASLYAMIPLTLVFIFFQKYMISGLTAGAVKG